MKAGDHGTLRRRVLVTGTMVSVLLVAGLGAFVAVNANMRYRLSAATDAYAEEERIANDLTEAVMRQLLLVSVGTGRRLGGLSPEFQEAGDEANALIQRYLFRDLTSEERLQLETVKAEHQRLEVAASRAAEPSTGTATGAPGASSAEMLEHATALLEALDTFLLMRASGLDRLRARQDAAFEGFYLAGGVFAVFILVGSLYLGRFLQRRVAAPLTELAEAARKIGEGDLEARVPVDHDREFAAVARTFNRMGEELAQAQADLEGRNRQLAELLETVRQAQAELIESEKLSAMGRMTAGLAHELNNPLAAVLGFGSLLRDRLAADGDVTEDEIERDYLGPMLRDAARARELVRNFTLFARGSETGVGPVLLREALRVVVTLRRFAFEKAGLELSVGEIPDVWVRAERQRLQEVFLNLVNNAFDAMEERDTGRLRIEGEHRGDDVLLRFRDEGPGVENLDRLFEPFYTTKAVGAGAGLGLAMVHRAMEDFGGDVRVENAPGGGALFTLAFTVVEAPPEPAASGSAASGSASPGPAASGTRARGRDTLRPTAAAPDGGAPPTPGPARDGETLTGSPAPPRILVVEDEAPLRRLQERILGRLSAEVLVARSVADAWPILESGPVDLIVSDVKMPGESGLELFRRVRESRPELLDRFLFVTGDVGDPAISKLSAERPEMFLRKPFEVGEYLDRVSVLLGVRPDV